MTRRLLLALLLAFVLPLAQVAAAAHEVSHVQGSKDQSAPVAVHCDLCAVAAAVSGGAAPSANAAVAPPTITAGAASASRDLIPPTSESAAPFESRAPPFPR